MEHRSKKLTSNTPVLSYREQEILNQIQNMVGGSVKLNVGQQSDCGLNIALIGFGGASVCGSRSPFMITPHMLREMSEDSDKYQMWMSWIQQSMQRQTTVEGWLQDNQRRAEQMDIEQRVHRVRVGMMSVLDFWNDNRNEGRSWTQPIQGQTIQRMAASRYEQMLSSAQ